VAFGKSEGVERGFKEITKTMGVEQRRRRLKAIHTTSMSDKRGGVAGKGHKTLNIHRDLEGKKRTGKINKT